MDLISPNHVRKKENLHPSQTIMRILLSGREVDGWMVVLLASRAHSSWSTSYSSPPSQQTSFNVDPVGSVTLFSHTARIDTHPYFCLNLGQCTQWSVCSRAVYSLSGYSVQLAAKLSRTKTKRERDGVRDILQERK